MAISVKLYKLSYSGYFFCDSTPVLTYLLSHPLLPIQSCNYPVTYTFLSTSVLIHYQTDLMKIRLDSRNQLFAT